VVTVQACNQGQSPSSGASIEVVLSSTGVISSSDIAVGDGMLAPLSPGGCQTLYLPVYPFQPEGSYVLGARVDPTGDVWELIETNNTSTGATITLTP
jgi:subtilase family serine protease